MSEKGTFDAAVNELKISVMQIKVEGIGTKLLPQYQAAIRVLEAAWKVDKVDCLDKLEFLRRMAGEDKAGFVRYQKSGSPIFPTLQIRDLLESLPDKEPDVISEYLRTGIRTPDNPMPDKEEKK